MNYEVRFEIIIALGIYYVNYMLSIYNNKVMIIVILFNKN